MKHKRIVRVLFLGMMFIFLGFGVTACAKKDKADEKLSRSEYIGLLGDKFGIQEYEADKDFFSDVNSSNSYYSQVQACAEWEVIEASGKFNPDDEVSLKFALESAVKAIGIDNINDTGKQIDINKLMDFYASHIANIDVSNPDSKINTETAEQILDYAVKYRDNMEFPQVCESTLKDGVKNADLNISLNYDGKTGIIRDNAPYEVGDIVYWRESDTSMARGIKITSITDGLFYYEDAELEDVYSTLKVSGTFDANVIEATSASDGTIVNFKNNLYNEISTYGVAYSGGKSTNKTFSINENVQPEAVFLASGVNVDKGKNHVVFKAQISGKGPENGSKSKYYGDMVVAIKNIKTTVDYEHVFLNPLAAKEISATVTFDTEISSDIKADFSRTIPLGEVYLSVWGPINLRMALSANIGANGEVSISYTTDNALYVGWKKGNGLQKSFNSNPELNYNADTTLTVEATILCDLVIGWKDLKKSIVNAEVTTGLVAIGKSDGDLLSKEPICTDVLVYVPLRWGINQRACILTDIKADLKCKQTVWDSTNSRIQLHMHFENQVRTAGDKCTRGDKKEVVQEKTDEKGNPINEIELFDFEVLDFDIIRLETYLVFLDENSSAKIGVTYLPEGYSENDLVYDVDNSEICSVNGGNITTHNEGSTIVRVHTSDNMFTVSFAVIVMEDYNVEGFKPL